MPSIPQSLLWISLVVLWLFVLVPMLINRRDTVRRTSDLALSTRVLNSGAKARLLRRGGPAAGHRHDPDWRPEDAGIDEDYQDYEAQSYEAQSYEAEDYEQAVHEAMREAMREAGVRSHPRAVMIVADTADADTEPVYLDVDVVDEDSGALPVGGGVQETLFDQPPAGTGGHTPSDEPTDSGLEPEPVAETDETAPDGSAEEYEYIEDTSGLEAEAEADLGSPVGAGRSNRRRRLESTAAAVSARKYRFRKRVLTAMAAIMVATAVLSFTVSAELWWSCGASAAVMVLYLGYLRRQTRIEEQVRRRRQQRMTRPRFGDDGFDERFTEEDLAASRLHRPDAVVLDIDDEDPMFEHLDEVPYSRRYDLPRAAGQ